MSRIFSYPLLPLLFVTLLVACGNDPELMGLNSDFSPPRGLDDAVARDKSGLGAQRSTLDQYSYVSITWDGASANAAVNLDLHVLDPDGNEINLTNTVANSGLFLDHSECPSFDCKGTEENPRETIYWPRNRLKPGTYKAWVENISDSSSNFEIEVMFANNQVKDSGSAAAKSRSREWTWTVEDDASDCLGQLRQLGVQFETVSMSQGSCTVEDGVMISSPFNGVTYRYQQTTTRFRTSCEQALALHSYTGELRSAGVTDVHHNGSYACRNIAGTSQRSTHGHARAMDFMAFDVNGSRHSVLSDWGSGAKGETLLRFSEMGGRYYQTVLDPRSNADHRDHFHMDIGR